MSLPTPPMAWDAWGDPTHATSLTDSQLAMVTDLLEIRPGDVQAVSREQVRLRPSALRADDLARLSAVVGDSHVSSDDADRLPRAGGKSTLDLLRRKSGSAQEAHDAVVVPGTDDEVLRLLEVCGELRLAVVPFGGGTSVVGGLDPVRDTCRGVVSLDLRRFDEVGHVDDDDHTVALGAGLSGPVAEQRLAEQGYELGHYPQSFRFATIGGFAATRSSGQDSSGYGRFDDMVQGLRVVTPRGVLTLDRPAPKTAAGPDLRQLFLGSEGTFGIITEVRVRVHPVPEAKHHEAWWFPDFATGVAAIRAVKQGDSSPTVIRLSDEVETTLNLATVTDAGGSSSGDSSSGDSAPEGGCLGVTVFEGTAASADARQAIAQRVLREHGGTPLGPQQAEAWVAHRFDGPYLRDPLLASGALVETLETVTSWSRLAEVKQAVTEAIMAALEASGSRGVVLCHLSHAYPTGASLYFTVVGAQRGDAIEQWRTIKAAASDAIMAHGGSITHHHAVGVDHREWMAEEIGDLGVEILRAVKATLDPAGVLNPGKLIP